MSEHMAPMDEFSSIPLPLVPVELPENPELKSTLRHELGRWDLHHAFHPSSSLKTESELVIRHSRVQYGPRYTHARYHQFFTAVELPATEEKKFSVAVLALAGYMPDHAVDVSGMRPKIVTLDDQERQILSRTVTPETRKITRTGKNRDQIRRGCFLMKHILDQDLDHVWQPVLEEFLYTPNNDRRRHLGYLILAKATERAAEPVNELYSQAYQRGFIQPDKPRGVVRLMQNATVGYARDYFDTLHRRVEEAIA